MRNVKSCARILIKFWSYTIRYIWLLWRGIGKQWKHYFLLTQRCSMREMMERELHCIYLHYITILNETGHTFYQIV
uniref:Putative secreted protein n=1 Tax=Anopheles triannulatus TaxID=58253 RepID=A0A2M4B714_9DIPT